MQELFGAPIEMVREGWKCYYRYEYDFTIATNDELHEEVIRLKQLLANHSINYKKIENMSDVLSHGVDVMLKNESARRTDDKPVSKTVVHGEKRSVSKITIPHNMNRNKIIESLYNSKEINQALSNVRPDHLVQDLRQELFLTLCSLPDDKFQRICASNDGRGLIYFALRTIWNMGNSGRSTFHGTFRKKPDTTAIKKHLVTLHSKGLETQGDAAMRAFNKLPWYNRELLQLYIDCDKSTKKMQEMTGIEARTIRYNLSKSRAIIKKDMRKRL